MKICFKSATLAFLLIATVFIIVGCSDSSLQKESTLSEEELHNNLSEVFDEICSVNDRCLELAGAFSEHDIGGTWFDACFDDYDVTNNKNYNESFKNWVTKNRGLISSIPDEVEAANSHLKEFSDYSDDSYYNAVKDLCVEVNTFADFLTTWPTGYSELTYWQKANDLSSQITSLISAAEFEK